MPGATAVITAPANSGRWSSPTCSGGYREASMLADSSVADTEAAAANTAITMPATQIVLVNMVRIVSSGRARVDWLTISATITASPPNSGTTTSGSRNGCVSSSEAPKNAAVEPTAANRIAAGSFGA